MHWVALVIAFILGGVAGASVLCLVMAVADARLASERFGRAPDGTLRRDR